MYTGAILSLLLYGAPIRVNALMKVCYNIKLTRVQRLINIRIAKSYRTFSNEALCIITGLNPIDIKIKETAHLFQITKGNKKSRSSSISTREQNTGFTLLYLPLFLKIVTRMTAQYFRLYRRK
jgi:hypothetical protein